MTNSIPILNSYTSEEPSNQCIVDIFDGEWSSSMPVDFALESNPGTASLFDDPRIHWLNFQVGGFRNLSVLELGPLEGGHTFMFCEGGASRVLSVESNSRSFLKCLCVKEMFELQNVKFLYGDAEKFLKKNSENFDLLIASGILYHVTNPVSFISNICRSCENVFVWTHYYDTKVIDKMDASSKLLFSKIHNIEFEGNSYEMSTKKYDKALEWAGFCGGPEPYSNWLTRKSLFDAFKNCGFDICEIAFEQLEHPNGPSLAFIAKKVK